MRRSEGRYPLRTNLTDYDPDALWRYYMQLVYVEEAFHTLKGYLAIRPVYHQKPERTEAHLFVAFLAYCLSIMLLISRTEPAADVALVLQQLGLALPAQPPPRIRTPVAEKPAL